ncbi:co-chaperone YbbN [Oscillibacter sp.]|uniref:thioredoxin family protein n=1 Tax=Oscillibacter sp. TaxID=1945593 RepID=UPI00261FEF1B|nr:thioredoxin family protein [Oscillibacter sp.]MDD3346182.1 thioredoxin [Oscillibacter sp.]
MIDTITKENFEQVVEKAERPVLLELWAPWCVYCRRLAPALDRVSEKRSDSLSVGKINIDEEPDLARKLDAEVIPTLYVYQNGSHGEKLVAPASQAQLEAWIEEQLGK